MRITRAGSQPVKPGPADWFTGAVRLEPSIATEAPARLAGALVRFEPGARTNWHRHPLGQTLIIASGQGLVQREGDRVQVVRPGDVVWFPPGERHWHGASPDEAMSHWALQEADAEGVTVTWEGPVSEAEYRAG